MKIENPLLKPGTTYLCTSWTPGIEQQNAQWLSVELKAVNEQAGGQQPRETPARYLQPKQLDTSCLAEMKQGRKPRLTPTGKVPC